MGVYRSYKKKVKDNPRVIRVKMFLAGLVMVAATVFLGIKQGVSQLTVWSGVIAFMFLSYPKISKWNEDRKKARERKKYLKSSLYDIDHMEGVEFEEWAKAWYEQMGYEVDLTPTSNDYGADLLVYNGDESVAVQCKRYAGKVGVSAVQQIIGAVAYYKVDRGEVITNSFYTAQARSLAAETGVKLYDRNSLIEIPKLKKLPEHGAEGDQDV